MKTCECKHEPASIDVTTLMKEHVCKKCGRTFFYKNYKPLFAITIIFVVISIALGVYALISVARLIEDTVDTVICIIVYLAGIWLIPKLIKYILRKIYARFGEKVTMVLPKSAEPIPTGDTDDCCR